MGRSAQLLGCGANCQGAWGLLLNSQVGCVNDRGDFEWRTVSLRKSPGRRKTRVNTRKCYRQAKTEEPKWFYLLLADLCHAPHS